MRRIVLKFGLISGVLSSTMMLITIPFEDKIGFGYSLIVGYTTIVASFLLVYLGIRSYRNNVGGGKISFGRAFAVGISITLITCIFYVVTWEVMYFKFMPDFLSKYQAHMLDKARAGGATEEALAKQKAEMDQLEVQYHNPLYNSAITLVEPLPVGLLIALVSAGVLSRRREPDGNGGIMRDAQGAN